MLIQIDRNLPVPIPLQIQGQIEFGVTNGDFPPGSRLPSVRELSAQLGVSPVTVSGVYQKLQASGLIESAPGRGTIVREHPGSDLPRTVDPIDHAMRRVLTRGDRRGLTRAELIERFQRIAVHHGTPTHVRCAFVGVYPEVTRSYVADLRRHLAPQDEIIATTFQEIEANPSILHDRDLVITFAHRIAELDRHVQGHTRIESIALIPSERTRVALAEIDPLAHVVLVSAVPAFVVTFRRAVERFANHVAAISTGILGGPELENLVASADVVVYATGAESIVDGMHADVRTFEYRHVPDPIHVESVLLPRIEQTRGELANLSTAMEAI